MKYLILVLFLLAGCHNAENPEYLTFLKYAAAQNYRQTIGVDCKDVVVVHKEGNFYTGMIDTGFEGPNHFITINAYYDGKNVTWLHNQK